MILTYLDILPIDILNIIYQFLCKLNFKDVMIELETSLKNDISLSNKYLQTYNNLLKNIEKPFYLNRNPAYTNTYFFTVYYNKWLRKNYLNEDRIHKRNIIIDSHTSYLIHTYDLLYLYVNSPKKLKQTLYRLEYYDLVSLKNFIKS